jgi:hypothetical protein
MLQKEFIISQDCETITRGLECTGVATTNHEDKDCSGWRLRRFLFPVVFATVTLASATIAPAANAQSSCTIEFTGKASAHSSTFVFNPGYDVECNATFEPTVTPADPRLGSDPVTDHFHVFNGTQGQAWANMHMLSGMHSRDVIQMTYNRSGITLFDVTGICVADGSIINLGVMWADSSIGVYNNLSAGCWNLGGGSNLTRLTIEGIGDSNPAVDSITINGY